MITNVARIAGRRPLVLGELSLRPTDTRSGRNLAEMRVTGGDDKRGMLIAFNSAREDSSSPRLMRLEVGGNLCFSDDNGNLGRLRVRRLIFCIQVTNLWFDRGGYWYIDGQIIDHGRLAKDDSIWMNLRGCDCAVNYFPSGCRGILWIDLGSRD